MFLLVFEFPGTRAPGSENIPFNNEGGLSGGQIAGIVIGVIVAIALL